MVLFMHRREAGEIVVPFGKDEGVRGLHQEWAVNDGTTQKDRVAKPERFELVEEDEIGRANFLIEMGQALVRLPLPRQVLQELEIGGEVIFNRSLASSDDDVESPDPGPVQLFEDGLNDGFELEGLVTVSGNDGKHLLRDFFGEREQTRPDAAGGDQG